MSEETPDTPILSAEDIAGGAFGFRHPLAPETGCTMAVMSRRAGLSTVAVNLVRIAPGRQAFPAHRHHAEEEWVYVVSGTADVSLDGTWHRLDAGGFAAFLPGGPAHAVRNAGESELVCLMGGSQPPAEIVDFPDYGKRVAFASGQGTMTDMADGTPFNFADAMGPVEETP
ncbi:MAG: cupin domain-containing protein [Pseudomonadota bacterium]